MKAFEKWRKSLLGSIAGIAAVCLVGAGALMAPVVAEEAGTDDTTVTVDTHTCGFFVNSTYTPYAKCVGGADTATITELAAILEDYAAWYYTKGNATDGSTDSSVETPESKLPSFDDWKVDDGYSRAVLVHLTEDVTLEQAFLIPEGVTVGICLNGYSLNTEYNYYGNGSVYIFDCNLTHECGKLGNVPIMTQNSVGFIEAWILAGGGVYAADGFAFAASEYLYFSENWGRFLQGLTLNVCLCRNSLDVDNLTSAGVTVNEVDCTLHECPYLWATGDENSMAQSIGYLTQMQWAYIKQMFDSFATEMEQLTSDIAMQAFLESDIVWDESIVLPEKLHFGICLNGYQVVGLPETMPENLYLYDCHDQHKCSVIGATLPAVSQGLLDFLAVWQSCGGNVMPLNGDMVLAASSDLTFGAEWTGIVGERTWTICKNGYTLGDCSHLPTSGNVNLVDCLVEGAHRCDGLEGAAAQPMDEQLFTPYCDENGVFVGSGTAEAPAYGTYAFYLDYVQDGTDSTTGKMASKVVIPSGMDVRVCLNGRMLTSPTILLGIEGQADTLFAFEVEEGGKLTICDCSPNQTGCIRTEINDSNTEGLAGIAKLLAGIVANAGEFTLNGGTLYSMIPVMNFGTMTVNGGNLNGMLMGVYQLKGENVESSPTLTVNGGAVGGYAGLAGSAGEMTVNGGTINALAIGVGSSAGDDENSVGADVVLNGGEIVFTTDGWQETAAAMGLNINEDEDGETIIELTDACAIYAEKPFVMTDDVDIIYTDEFIAAQQAAEDKKNAELEANGGTDYDAVEYGTIDITLKKGASIVVPAAGILENEYKVLAESAGQTIANQPMQGTFVPVDGFAVLDEYGNMIAIPSDPSGLYTADVVSATLSTTGTLMMNFYLQLDTLFVENGGKIKFIIDGNSHEVFANELTPQDGYYVYSVPVAAKDYKKTITCSFKGCIEASENVLVNCTWDGATTSVEQYLRYIIDDTTGAYTDVEKQTAKGVITYCMTAAVHFGVESVYHYEAGMEELLATYTTELCENNYSSMLPTLTGADERVTLLGATLLLKSSTSMRFYFKLQEGALLGDVSLSIAMDGETWYVGASTENEENGIYYVEINDIASVDLGKEYVVQIGGYTLEYSAVGYAYTLLKSAATNADSVALARAIFEYYRVSMLYQAEEVVS